MNASRASIIILNWNGWRDTAECLESVYRIDYPNYDVIVVDNGSRDDSIKRIKEYCLGEVKVESKFFECEASNKPLKVFEISQDEAGSFNPQLYERCRVNKKVILIKNKKNYGFAGGNNIGIKFALNFLKPEYILLLNNDTVVSENLLKELVKTAENDRKIGIVGPKIYFYDYKGRSDVISFTGEDLIPWKGTGQRYGSGEMDDGRWDKPMELDRIEGSCMLIRKDVFERVGFFDEIYFCYYEETDFCIRAKRVGFKIKYCPTARIWHKVAASTGGRESPKRIYFLTRNRIIFIRKNFPNHLWKHFLYIIFYEIWHRLGVSLLYRRDPKALWYYLTGLIDGYKALIKRKIVKGWL
ncbi:glycosyltransferase family 2 protein [Candidatus Bathyarchaeota archaeon]|nr:glycosyltransferase family 2 protein [Candidatus Bathyarchaeota archaeon]